MLGFAGTLVDWVGCRKRGAGLLLGMVLADAARRRRITTVARGSVWVPRVCSAARVTSPFDVVLSV